MLNKSGILTSDKKSFNGLYFSAFCFSIAEFRSNSILPSSSGILSLLNKLKLHKDFDKLIVFLTGLFLCLLFPFVLSTCVFLSVTFWRSLLSSQFIETFSDFAEVFLWIDEARIFVFTFFGAEIGSSCFFWGKEFKFIFEFALNFGCFFVITGFKGRLTWRVFINEFCDLVPCVIFSKNCFSFSYI